MTAGNHPYGSLDFEYHTLGDNFRNEMLSLTEQFKKKIYSVYEERMNK